MTGLVWKNKPKRKEDVVKYGCGMKMSGKVKSPMVTPKSGGKRKIGGK